MVCFQVEICIPRREREQNEAALESRIQHILKHNNAEYKKLTETEDKRTYSIRVCDEETVSVLRDFPQPFHVKQIQLSRSGEILYLYRRHFQPPRIPLFQNVYWMAKSAEKWKF